MQLDTHTGTWMSVDVSPDGQRLVFDLLGDLYTLPIAGGEAVALTHSIAWEMQARWSPDGKRLAFISDAGGGDNVWVMNADGGDAHAITTENFRLLYTPAWSPDGQYIAARKHFTGTRSLGSGEIWLYHASGVGKGVQLNEKPNWQKDLGEPAFSPDGEVELASKLVRIDLDDRFKEHEVATSEFVSDYAVSPDGRWLAFEERDHAYVTPLPLSSKPVAVGAKMDALPLRQVDVDAGEYLHWSGDSTKLHFGLGDRLFTSELRNAFTFMPGAPRALTKADDAGVRVGFAENADTPTGFIAITGARIVTMKGDEVIADGTIVIDGNRIDAVGPTASIFAHAEMQRAGIVTAPRIFSTGTILYGAKASITQPIDSLDDAPNALRRQKAFGAISVKSYNQPRREQRQQILEAARETDMMVVPEGGALSELNMTMVVDGHTGVEHAIPVENAYDDVKQLWGQTQVGYTPTYNVAYGGLDGEHYWYATTEVWKHPILKDFVPRSVLESRSINGAHYLGMDRDIGSLEVGKLADLVIIDGDPIADIRQSDRVVDVMQDGRLYALPRLDEIAPRAKPRQPFFFDGADGAAMPVSTRGHGHGDGEGGD